MFSGLYTYKMSILLEKHLLSLTCNIYLHPFHWMKRKLAAAVAVTTGAQRISGRQRGEDWSFSSLSLVFLRSKHIIAGLSSWRRHDKGFIWIFTRHFWDRVQKHLPYEQIFDSAVLDLLWAGAIFGGETRFFVIFGYICLAKRHEKYHAIIKVKTPFSLILTRNLFENPYARQTFGQATICLLFRARQSTKCEHYFILNRWKLNQVVGITRICILTAYDMWWMTVALL